MGSKVTYLEECSNDSVRVELGLGTQVVAYIIMRRHCRCASVAQHESSGSTVAGFALDSAYTSVASMTRYLEHGGLTWSCTLVSGSSGRGAEAVSGADCKARCANFPHSVTSFGEDVTSVTGQGVAGVRNSGLDTAEGVDTSVSMLGCRNVSFAGLNSDGGSSVASASAPCCMSCGGYLCSTILVSPTPTGDGPMLTSPAGVISTSMDRGAPDACKDITGSMLSIGGPYTSLCLFLI
eukprot:707661-Prorocentrum_minimum.AAC.4